MNGVVRPSTILIVDENQETQGQLSEILRHDYRVLSARSAEDALECAQRYRPDMILLDAHLSQIDGFEVCVRLKAAQDTEAIPVVFLNDSDADEESERAFHVGGVDVIHKPLRPIEVRNRVDSQIRRWQNEQEMRRRALYDSLTGLPGRSLSFDRLQHTLAQDQRNQRRTGLLFVDLDNFKTINDNLGHEAGDELLVQAAQRFEQQIRRGDTVGRLGGDEFLIILAALREGDDAKTVAENIQRAFEPAMRLGGVAQRVGISIGVALSPDDGIEAKRLIASADAAMYQAKQMGRGCVQFFTQTMNADVGRRIMLERQLNRAMENDELFVEYQPIVETESRRVVGAEALLRWKNSTLGDVTPGEFILQAEHSGLIWPIGEFVIRTACEDLRELCQADGEPLALAINTSAQQLRRSSFPTLLEAILRETGFEPARLHIEVTESLLLNRGGVIESNLIQLREMGVRLSMDDFGTGFSSLSYLSSHQFDILKIDRLFVESMRDDPQHDHLVSASIAMADALGLDVVAEGVESEDQLRSLRGKGCRLAQGNHFGEPMRLGAFMAHNGLTRRSPAGTEIHHIGELKQRG